MRKFRYLDTLTIVFVVVLVISNLVGPKMCQVGPFKLSGAELLFPITYIFGDVFTEVYGYAASRRAIWMGFLAMGLLGMGNGSVFQIAPQRFPADIELVTGVVGAAGGLGGFFLPSAIGALKDMTGSFGVGLFCFALLVLGGALLLLEFGVRWSATWKPDALRQTMVFSYRGSRRETARFAAATEE